MNAMPRKNLLTTTELVMQREIPLQVLETLDCVQACDSISENSEEISKMGWGGPRPNSGGKRDGAGRKPKSQVSQPIEIRWYVAEAEHKKLYSANQELLERGFETYLPTEPQRRPEIVNRKPTGRYITVLRPMFFQFWFVRLDLSDPGWAKVRVPGVKRLLSNSAGIPHPVERGGVEFFKADEPNRIKLPEVELERLKPGRLPMVTTGPRMGPDGEERYHPLGGQVVEVISCDGLMTTVYATLFGGRIKMNIRRADLVDE
jgi:transcription antitermination factor NusG